MANTPISGLPTATSVDGTELVPVVQGGVTKQATVSLVKTIDASQLTTGTLPNARLSSVPKSALATAVQTSLTAADNALPAASAVPLSSTTPAILSTAGSAGSASSASRSDHAHPLTGLLPTIPRYTSGGLYYPGGYPINTVSPHLAWVFVNPFIVWDETLTIDQLGTWVWTAGSTGAAARLGVYALNNGRATGTALGEVSVAATATGNITGTLGTPLALKKGIYGLALCAQGSPTTAPAFNGYTPTHNQEIVNTTGWGTNSTVLVAGYTGGGSFTGWPTGSLPDLTGVTPDNGLANAPLVYVRKQ